MTTEEGRDYINEQYQRFDAPDQASLIRTVQEMARDYSDE